MDAYRVLDSFRTNLQLKVIFSASAQVKQHFTNCTQEKITVTGDYQEPEINQEITKKSKHCNKGPIG
jgi:hypothetical protein